jgi:hypothetical protein
MDLRVQKLKKAFLLLCILLFLIDLGDDGCLGPTKSLIGWGHHGIRKQTESFSLAIRPLPPKIKILSVPYANSLVAIPHIAIQEICNALNFMRKIQIPGRSCGGIPL